MTRSMQHMVLALVGIWIFFWLWIVGLVLCQTIVYDPPFYSEYDRGAIIKKSDGKYYFRYWRTVSVRRQTFGKVARHIVYTPNGKIIELDDSSQMYEPVQNREMEREFLMGVDIERGEWCLEAWLSYRPDWSLRDHIYVAPKVCANVTE